MSHPPSKMFSKRFTTRYRKRILLLVVTVFLVIVSVIHRSSFQLGFRVLKDDSKQFSPHSTPSQCGAISKKVPDPGATNNYFLPEGYQTNKLRYFNDLTTFRLIYQADIYNLAVNLSRQHPNSTFIDVGSGTGLKSSYLYEKVETDRKFAVLDFGANLEIARENFMKTTRYKNQKAVDDAAFYEWDIDNNPFPSEIPSDLIKGSIMVVADVIEHLINPDRLVDKLLAVMSGCGTRAIIISTPDRDSYSNWSHFGPPTNLHHIREWGLEELKTYLQSRNLPVKECIPTWSLDKARKRKDKKHTTACLISEDPLIRFPAVEEMHDFFSF